MEQRNVCKLNYMLQLVVRRLVVDLGSADCYFCFEGCFSDIQMTLVKAEQSQD